MTDPIRTVTLNPIAIAEGLQSLRLNAMRVKKASERYPVFLTIADYQFVMVRHKQTFEQLVARLEEMLWSDQLEVPK